jgi:alpha-tubulin suppressor-like RCC1 family protein
MLGARSVVAGEGHSLALMADGTVQAWGGNWSGQLGDGTTTARKERVTVQGLTGAVALTVGLGHSLAVRQDGTVWAWGDNFDGQLGDGTKVQRRLPTQVPGLTGVVSVAAGEQFSLALKQDGTVWAWGANFNGQLGNGTKQPQLTPLQVPGLTRVTAIESGSHSSVVLRDDGTVWAWGFNSRGQLGDGEPSSARLSPAPVQGLSKVVAVSMNSSHGMALREDGSVWTWGDNPFGALGNGTEVGSFSPPRKVPGVQGVVALAAGSRHSVVLRRDGTLWTWGHHGSGVTGTGTEIRNAPVRVRGLRHVRSLASHEFHTLAVEEDGSVWAWGVPPTSGQGVQNAPSRVHGLRHAKAAAVGAMHALALKQDGTVWSWGVGSRGQLGRGTTDANGDTPAPVRGLSGVVAVAAGDVHSLALRADGTVWAWGANHYSQLGDMTLEDQPVPVQAQGLQGVAAIAAYRSFSVALKTDGSVWVWGSDESLWSWGDMSPMPPVLAEGLEDVVAVGVGGGSYTLEGPGVVALRTDGTVWQWNLLPEPGPWQLQQLPGLMGAVAVAVSANTIQALRADGSVWNIGSNAQGERGLPDFSLSAEAPVRVPGVTKGVALSAAAYTVHVVREDGTVVGWGNNWFGTIGGGTSPLQLKPVRIPMPCMLPARASGGEAD